MTRGQANEHLAHIITAVILIDEVDFDGFADALDTTHVFRGVGDAGREHAELTHLRDLVQAARAFQAAVHDLELARMQAGEL